VRKNTTIFGSKRKYVSTILIAIGEVNRLKNRNINRLIKKYKIKAKPNPKIITPARSTPLFLRFGGDSFRRTSGYEIKMPSAKMYRRKIIPTGTM
jgi:hypothetical protein